MYKVDLHTHSELSHDGGLSEDDYRQILDSGRLDYVAVTDHNDTRFAAKLQKKLGEKIIIGEEINTGEGEIIGLYLTKKIEPMLGAMETVQAIRAQKALVYIPHPFEKLHRGGVQARTLSQIINEVDIIETHNGRAYRSKKSVQAKQWAAACNKASAASSDAHGPTGWGRTYSIIKQRPTKQNLASQIAKSKHCSGHVGFRGILYPTINRFKKKISK